ncbi:acetyltransferase, gnat family [Trichoderma arundinaceum]|uniref:Acetyltransferase, gnat family n=1 Tax=Trichoderma arundinaceum TaxID=490622 RepID=A0A395N9F9_TRIAR|nr:acetyltransferase, gnat family [Trichoderma arundinaceum]
MAEKPQNDNSSTNDALDGVLPLSYRVVTRDSEKQDALRLVADSIAQQRQAASAAIIFHPLCVAGLVAMCAGVYRQYKHAGYGTLMTMICGVVIVYLSFVRFYTSRYIELAEKFRWRDWTTRPDGKEDTIIAAVFGEEIIGAVVLRLKGTELNKKKGSAQASSDGHGIIRAWTTKLRYRGKGVGSDLLHFAVQTTNRAFGPAASVEFAADHANSANPLPDMFLRPFKRRQEKAAKALRQALKDQGNPQ